MESPRPYKDKSLSFDEPKWDVKSVSLGTAPSTPYSPLIGVTKKIRKSSPRPLESPKTVTTQAPGRPTGSYTCPRPWFPVSPLRLPRVGSALSPTTPTPTTVSPTPAHVYHHGCSFSCVQNVF